ncbi:MAG: glycosyltransferase [Anaerolineales bacterium]|jgi:1,2-diacylglycerol 3-beta-galactosyltransferase
MSNLPRSAQPHILVLFSDTGGGHRSAAEAVVEALQENHRGEFSFDMVDAFVAYAPYPLNLMPTWYPQMMRWPGAWEMAFRVTDSRGGSRAFSATLWPWVQNAARQLVREHPADMILNFHPVFNAPVMRALGKNRPPFITVVTDLVSTHALWFHRQVDLCLVPTEPARSRGLVCGLSSERIRVVGLPVKRRFCVPAGDKAELRRRLGWPVDIPVVLLVGGGEGMGPLYKTAREIERVNTNCALAIIAGRNEKLRLRLENSAWTIPAFVYGFVTEMPDLMRAADLLVTKAGPGTISEALNASLPMVLYSRLPGQEDGNVLYVVEEGAGLWAPGPKRTAQAVAEMLTDQQRLERAAQCCRRVARPQAAEQVASLAWQILQSDPTRPAP